MQNRKPVKALAVILLLTIFVVMVGVDIFSVLGNRTLVYGAKGEDVRDLQTKLNALGFLDREADGVFDLETHGAVKWFQDSFGLWDDGVVNTSTWVVLNQIRPREAFAQSGTASSNDVYVLAKMISGEARGEPYIGQVAVGAVIMNRVRNSKFPNSVYSVCFQPGAFDAIRDGQYYSPPTESALKAARAALSGWDPTYGALYYWNPATATSRWIWSRRVMLQIGKHNFGI